MIRDIVKNRLKHRQGFSLIELLISMLVASIIIMGVYNFLTSSHRSFTFTKANDNVNRAMMISNRTMSNFMKLAGFRNYRRVIDNLTFTKKTVKFADGISNTFPVNTFIMGDATNLAPPVIDAQPNDILYIRYFGSSIDDDLSEKINEPDDAKFISNRRMYDCNGEFLTRMDEVFLKFMVDTDGLVCFQVKHTYDKSGAFKETVSPKVILNPNVVSILFGFRVDGDPTFYLAGDVKNADVDSSIVMQSTNKFELVNALRYGILVRENTHQKMTTTSGDKVYHMLGFDDSADVALLNRGSCTAGTAGCDSAQVDDGTSDIFQLVSGILHMRNRFYESN